MEVVRKFDHIFPTIINIIDDVLEPEYIDSMVKHIMDSSKVGRKKNWQSEDNPHLHKHPKYKALSDKVLEVSKMYIDDLQFEFESHYISGMWSNILKPGETHGTHTHSNNFLSGVYYPQADGNSPAINFMDPRPQASVIQPHATKYTKVNSNIYYYPAKTNRMLLFPSWLQHYVPANETNQNRISIAFNVMFHGEVGRPKNFQTATF